MGRVPDHSAGGWKLWIQRIDGSDGRFLEQDRLDSTDTSETRRGNGDFPVLGG